MIRLATLSSSGRAEEHDALAQQAGVDVVGPFAPVGGLDDGGDEHGFRSSFVQPVVACSSVEVPERRATVELRLWTTR